MECEYLAKKFDRFGWERDRNTPAQDRQKLDFMDALQDYPLDEVRDACRAAVLSSPNRMPNEGHILSAIMEARKSKVAALPRTLPAPEPAPAPVEKRRAFAAMVLSNAGLAHTMPKGLDE